VNYFTPELFVRLQEYENDENLMQASENWERAVRGYAAHLKEIAPFLSDGPSRFVRRRSFHDATVVNLWSAKTRLTILLQEEGSTDEVVLLTYSLVEAPYLDTSALPERYRSAAAAWLYDEIDVDRDTCFDVGSGIRMKSAPPRSTSAGRPGQWYTRTPSFSVTAGNYACDFITWPSPRPPRCCPADWFLPACPRVIFHDLPRHPKVPCPPTPPLPA
jgi:hypothetical protein